MKLVNILQLQRTSTSLFTNVRTLDSMHVSNNTKRILRLNNLIIVDLQIKTLPSTKQQPNHQRDTVISHRATRLMAVFPATFTTEAAVTRTTTLKRGGESILEAKSKFSRSIYSTEETARAVIYDQINHFPSSS